MQAHLHGAEALKSYVPSAPTDAKMVEVEINGNKHQVAETRTILEACREHGYFVPTVCHHPRVKPLGRCQVCMVENATTGDMAIACSTRVTEGMRVVTNSADAIERQTAAIETLQGKQKPRFAMCREDFGASEFQSIAAWKTFATEQCNGAIRIRGSSCVQCGRCVAACSEIQEMDILELPGDDAVGGQGGLKLKNLPCIGCGQCALICPTDAIKCCDGTQRIREAGVLPKPCGLPVKSVPKDRRVSIVQTAPSVRVALGEEFGMAPGSVSTGKMVTALRRLGFDIVLDTNFAADLTIMEEAQEFLNRLVGTLEGKKDIVMPMFTSCCPGWVNLVEQEFPEFIPNLSSCRSPMSMYGPLMRTYVAKKLGIEGKDVYSVAIMPCVAKKHEYARPQLSTGVEGMQDTDMVLTTHELGQMIRDAGIDWDTLEETDFDSPINLSTGAAQMFGVTGGVMEAALRTAYEWATGTEMPKPLYNALPIHGFDGIKEATVEIPIKDGPTYPLRVAVCSGIKYARKLLNAIKSGEAPKYDFIEVMACPGGCINGGGQPPSLDPQIMNKRAAAIYSMDERSVIRKSHENPDVIKIYEEFLGTRGGHESHHLLHTHYTDRSKLFTRPTIGGDDAEGAEEQGAGEGETLYVVVSSMTGKGKALAARIATEAEQKSPPVNCKVILTQQTTLESLKKRLTGNARLVYMTSTFGNGEQPFVAKKFLAELEGAAAGSLAGVKFAVFGLGSKSYPAFCQAAKECDALFEKLGGERFCATGLGDESGPEGHDASFGPWLEQMWESMGVAASTKVVIPAVRYTTSLTVGMLDPPPCPPGFDWLPLKEIKVIVPQGAEREAVRMSFDLRGTDVHYETGWHIGILPRNNPNEVTRFCRMMGLNGDSAVVVRPIGAAPHIPGVTEYPLTIREILEQYLNLTGRVTKPFLKSMIPFSRKEDTERLEFLTSSEGAEEFRRDFIQECLTYVDVLEMFPTVRPTFDYLVDMIPQQQPRLYSIASSHLLQKRQLDMVVMMVDWETPGRRQCHGLATRMFHRWLKAPKGSVRVAAFTRSSPLQPPADPMIPITCVAMGVGVAPFRSFCQHREALHNEGIKMAPFTLYFGCRNKNQDALCIDELERWEKMGIVKTIWAFSRAQEEKVYVNHRIQQNGDQIKRDLGERDGFLGYCGAAGAAPKGVETAIKEHFTAMGLDAEARWMELGLKDLIVIEAY